MRVELPRRSRRPVRLLLMVAMMLASCGRNKSYAQDAASETRTTLVFFADHPMADGEWSAVFDALKKDFTSERTAVPALGQDAEFVRGDKMKSGIEVSRPISVYLHGRCALAPMEPAPLFGALGWVWRVQKHIQPFIHVDCAEIAQELGPLALGMDKKRRETVMGEAMARVVLHEWVHVATQNRGHSRQGVEKARFTLADLLADDEQVRRRPEMLKKSRNPL
jgi:hypothetical protein